MFNYMRKHAQGIVIVAVVAFVGTIFLVWGMGGEREGGNIAVSINGHPISLSQYMLAYENKRQFYRNVYKNSLTPALEKQLNLKQKTLDDLIARHLLVEQAHKEGLEVADDEVKAYIKRYPSFQENGVFSPRLYKQVLTQNRLNPLQFEEEQRQQMLLAKITGLIKDQVKVSKTELLEEYKRSREKIKVKFLLFNPELYVEQVTLTDEELDSYFAGHRQEYEQSQRRKIKYLLLKTKNLEPAEIREEEIKAYYESNQDKYHQPQQVRASHILLKVTPGTSEKVREGVKNSVEKLLARIKKGEDFAKLAREFSEDEGSAEDGGDLGYFSRGRMVPAFEEVAFSLVRGQVSELVETPYGYHIIKVLGVKKERTQTLEEVSANIGRLLKQDRSEGVGEELAEEAYLQLSEGKANWQELTERAEWESHETDFFSRKDFVPGVSPDFAFKEAAFKLTPEEISPPLKLEQGFALLQLLESKGAYLPELAEVKDEVEQALKQEKASQIAKRMAEEAGEKFKQGTPLEKLTDKLEVKESDYFGRREFIQEIGPAANFAAELFALEKGWLSSPLLVERGETKSYALFLLEDKQVADETKLESEEEQLRTQLLSLKQEQSLQSWLEVLRQKSEIEISPSLLD